MPSQPPVFIEFARSTGEALQLVLRVNCSDYDKTLTYGARSGCGSEDAGENPVHLFQMVVEVEKLFQLAG